MKAFKMKEMKMKASKKKILEEQFDLKIKQLTPSHILDLITLQDQVFEDLEDDKKHFIVPKKKSAFEVFLAKGQVFGMFVNGDYKGHMIVSSPVAEKDLTGGFKDLDINPKEAIVIHNVLICPSTQGMGLMSYMMGEIMGSFDKTGLKQAWSEVVPANEASMRGFLSAGFKIVDAKRDESDNCPLYFLKYETDDSGEENSLAEEFSCINENYDAIQAKLKQGNVIQKYDYKTKAVKWAKAKL